MNIRKSDVIDHRYRVIRTLGQGAMGVVYYVLDISANNSCALKILTRDAYNETAIQRFKQEFFYCAQLRHPHLASVYDFGVTGTGECYYTMEYIQGDSLSRAALSLSQPELYRAIVQICQALHYIHSRGIVHRDIKPGNIIITRPNPDNGKAASACRPTNVCAKLMDFGLAGDVVSSRAGFQFKGTPEYAAPEVIKGAKVDHRADFYSLGVVLYELFTGRLPFEHDSIHELLKSHLTKVPDLPRKANKALPLALQRMIMRMLEKEPAKRYDSANEIITALSDIGGERFSPQAAEPAGEYPLSGVFVGRHREMEKVRAFFHEKDRKAKIMFIGGDTGIGKSRLMQEFRYFVQLEQGKYFTGHCYPYGNAVYQPFMEMLGQVALYAESKDPDHGQRQLSILRDFIPPGAGTRPVRGGNDVEELSPHDQKMRLFSSVVELINGLKVRGAVLLEDLQWIDDASAELLYFLARNLKADLTIYATYRTEELSDDHTLARLIARMTSERMCAILRMGPLAVDEISEFVQAGIGMHGDTHGLAQRLHEETGGNPFFIEEVVKNLARDGKIGSGQNRTRLDGMDAVSIPSSMREVLKRRLRDISIDGQSVMKAAAVIGRRFDLQILRRLAVNNDLRFYEAVRELIRRQVIVEKHSEDSLWFDFAAVKLKELIYETLTDDEKRFYHRRIGGILESSFSGKEDEIAEDLSDHFIWSDDRAKALRYSVLAGDKASRLFAHTRAHFFYDRAQDVLMDKKMPATVRDRIDLCEKQGNLWFRTNSYEKAQAKYRTMLTLAVKHGDTEKEIDALLHIGSIHQQTGYYHKALKQCKYAHRKACGAGDTVRQAACLDNVGLAYRHIGQYRSSMARYKRAFSKYRLAGNRAGEANTINGMGIVYFDTGRTKDGLELYNQALEIYCELGSKSGQAKMHNNIGVVYFRLGDHGEALKHFESALRLGAEMGSKFTQDRALYGIANVYNRCLSQYDSAMERYQAALSMSEEINDKEITAHTLNAMGDVHMSVGNYTVARDYFQRFLKLADETGDPACQSLGLLNLSGCYYRLGEYRLSLDFGRRSVRLGRETGYTLYCAAGHVTLATTHIALGDYDQALKNLNTAREVLKTTSSKELEDSILSGFAETYYSQGRYVDALSCTEKLLANAEAGGNKSLLAVACLQKSRLLGRNDYVNKKHVLSKAKRLMDENYDPEISWRIYYEEGTMFLNMGQTNRALDSYGRCIEVFKKVCASIKEEKFRSSYINDPRKQAVFIAIDKMKNSIG